jgi:hypothetical protein
MRIATECLSWSFINRIQLAGELHFIIWSLINYFYIDIQHHLILICVSIYISFCQVVNVSIDALVPNLHQVLDRSTRFLI